MGTVFKNVLSHMAPCASKRSASGIVFNNVLSHMAPYPSGKGEVCKTFMSRSDSDRRL